MNKLVEFSLRNRLLILILAGLLAIGGIYSLRQLPIDAVPDITNVQVQILTKAPALGPLEVEQFITYPVEAAMNGMPDVEQIRSISRYGISSVTVVFKEHVNLFFARQLVQERLTAAKESIPEGFGTPEMGPPSTGLGEIYHFVVEGDQRYSAADLRTILDWEIAYRLRSVPGVVEVNTWGGLAKQFEVRLDPQKLLNYRIPLRQVFEAIEGNNGVVGSAYIERYQEQVLIRGEGLIQGIKDLEDIVVALRQNGVPVRIKDLAQVGEGAMPRLGAATQDGTGEVVIGMAQMLVGENSRIVAERVKKKIEEIQSSLPPGVHIKTFYNRTTLVDRTIHTAVKNLIEGGILVIAVLLLLLGNLRGGLIVASAIPLSMLFAAIGMVRAKISGNLMSLGAIDFGLIVDGSVVMVENIIRTLGESHEKGRPLVERLREAALDVARPVAFAVSIIIIVYLPILTLQGTEGKMFKPMAYTVVFALIGSLILALTVMPALCSLVFRRGVEEKETRIMQWMRPRYKRILNWAMGRRMVVVSVAVGSFLLAAASFPFLGGEFIPSLDEGDLLVQAWRLPSISLKGSIETTEKIEQIIRRFPEVVTVVSRTGSPEIATDVMGPEVSDIFVILKAKKEWKGVRTKAELIKKMSDALSQEIPGVGFGFTQPIQMRFNELISGVRSDVAVKLFGEDLRELREKAEQITKVLSQVKGSSDVKMEQTQGLPTLRVVINRNEIARYGINAADVLATVEAIQAGRRMGIVLQGVRRFPIVAKFTFDHPVDIEHIRNLSVFSPTGIPIPLGQLAKVFIEDGPAQISRESGQRRIVIESNVRGRDIESFVREAQAKIDQHVKLPTGYFTMWGGSFEELERARERLIIVVPITLFLIFILLYSAFGSVRIALLVFTGVPLAAVGGVLSLFLRGIPFSISAGVGFIALFGVAVLNGVVMVSYFRKLEDEGLAVEEAVRQGAERRLRPVLMTALVASLGFIPMAISTSAGAEVQRPLATVVIGGLITSTILTLLVLPVIYAWTAKPKQEVEL